MKLAIRILLAAFFGAAGIAHFRLDDTFARIVPPGLPFPLTIVHVTGVMELCFAVALLAARGRWLALTGWALGAYLLAVLPANIYMAMDNMPLGATELGPLVLWGRVALQFPLIALVLWACEAMRSSDPAGP